VTVVRVQDRGAARRLVPYRPPGAWIDPESPRHFPHRDTVGPGAARQLGIAGSDEDLVDTELLQLAG
jgi:hypothetical protein